MFTHKICFFNNFTDTAPKYQDLSFDELCEQHLAHVHRGKKDGPMFSATSFRPGAKRCNRAALSMSLGIFDFDDQSPQPIRDFLREMGCRAVLVSTHSHSAAKPCFRVVIPFTAPIPARLWPVMHEAFDTVFEGASDPQTKAVSQAFYLPSCPAKNSGDAFSWTVEGEPFDAIATLMDLGHDCSEVDAGDDDHDMDEVSPRPARLPTGSSSKQCPRQLAEEIFQSIFNGLLKFFNFEFYAYEYGYWKPLNRKVDVEKRIMAAFKTLSIGVVKQIVENLESLTIVEDIAPASNFGGRHLCLNNGTLDLKTGNLLPHDPDHDLVNKMDVTWNPAATAPIFLTALKDIFKFDEDREARIQFILEWFGYCLIPDSSQHKFLWLVGSGRILCYVRTDGAAIGTSGAAGQAVQHQP